MILPSRAQLWPFAALSASYFAHIGFFNPYLSLWLKDVGYSIWAISVLTSVQAATRLFTPYFWGIISDRTGERVKLMRFCAVAAVLLTAALWFDLHPIGLALVLFLMFAHTSAMMPMSEAAMAHLVSQDGSFNAHRYGRIRLWGSLGFLVTVFVAGAWFERFGMHDFPAWTTLTLLAVAVCVAVLPDLKEQSWDAQGNQVALTMQPVLPVWPVLRQPLVAWFFASAFFHILAHMGIYVFLSLYLDSLGYSKTVIGVMWATSIVVEIAWFFTQSRWLGRYSLGGWLVVCAVVMMLRMALTAWGGSDLASHLLGGAVLAMLLFAQGLHAVTFATHHTVCIAMLSSHFAGRLRGRGQALYTVIGYGFPGVLGGLVGGALVSQYGLSAVYWSSIAISFIAMLCAIKVWQIQRMQVLTEGLFQAR